MVKALSEKSLAWFTYCPSMRSSGLRSTWVRLLLPAGVTLSRSEGSAAQGFEMLRGVYTERSECAQHDSIDTPAALAPSESVPLVLATTDADGSFLRLMPIRVDKSAVGAINRPLQMFRLFC
jgi:hypothetical protein